MAVMISVNNNAVTKNYHRMGVKIPLEPTALDSLMPDFKKSGRDENTVISELKKDVNIQFTEADEKKPVETTKDEPATHTERAKTTERAKKEK